MKIIVGSVFQKTIGDGAKEPVQGFGRHVEHRDQVRDDLDPVSKAENEAGAGFGVRHREVIVAIRAMGLVIPAILTLFFNR